MHNLNFDQLIKDIRHMLPIQNPLNSFLHNNMLQSFEDQNFFKGIIKAGELYRARPFLRHDEYLELYLKKRIDEKELKKAFETISHREKHNTQHQHHISFNYEDLFKPFDSTPAQLGLLPSKRSLRNLSPDQWRYLNHLREDFLVAFVSCYADQGQSTGFYPFHQDSLWAAFYFYIQQSPTFNFLPEIRGIKNHTWLKNTPSEIINLFAQKLEFNTQEETTQFFLDLLFDLRGWSGIINKLETSPDFFLNFEQDKICLIDWIAILCLCEDILCSAKKIPLVEKFQRISNDQMLHQIILEVFQLALDQTFTAQFHTRLFSAPQTEIKKTQTEIQVLLCMDDREESFRRHLEATNPKIKTYGVLGFFNLPIWYESWNFPHLVAQCPPVVTPQFTVIEKADSKFKKIISTPFMYRLSRSSFGGTLATLGFGLVSWIPFFLKSHFPQFFEKWRKKLKEFISPTIQTVLDYQNIPFEDQLKIIESVFVPIGLTKNWANYVVILGHQSTSVNNPFRQAYGCGACSGRSGAPNARLFAEILNKSDIRAALKAKSIEIPDQVIFIPAVHDTTLEQVNWLNANVPENIKKLFDQALKENAKERYVRLHPKNPAQHNYLLSQQEKEKASKKVMERAFDLAEPRPELGHSRVTSCILAPREFTYQKNLDRRAFLVSYEASFDPNGEWLRSLVGGAVLVAANILYDYYFSRCDSVGFGSSSKLPLNVISLLGVITGSKSDLKIGLARQMVEWHEPIRLHVQIHAETTIIEQVLEKVPRFKKLVLNEWILLFAYPPSQKELLFFKNGLWQKQELPKLPHSTKPLLAFDFQGDFIWKQAP